jgi:hypothetical protein
MWGCGLGVVFQQPAREGQQRNPGLPFSRAEMMQKGERVREHLTFYNKTCPKQAAGYAVERRFSRTESVCLEVKAQIGYLRRHAFRNHYTAWPEDSHISLRACETARECRIRPGSANTGFRPGGRSHISSGLIPGGRSQLATWCERIHTHSHIPKPGTTTNGFQRFLPKGYLCPNR